MDLLLELVQRIKHLLNLFLGKLFGILDLVFVLLSNVIDCKLLLVCSVVQLLFVLFDFLLVFCS